MGDCLFLEVPVAAFFKTLTSDPITSGPCQVSSVAGVLLNPRCDVWFVKRPVITDAVLTFSSGCCTVKARDLFGQSQPMSNLCPPVDVSSFFYYVHWAVILPGTCPDPPPIISELERDHRSLPNSETVRPGRAGGCSTPGSLHTIFPCLRCSIRSFCIVENPTSQVQLWNAYIATICPS